ncbi:hypothetical protein [Pseudomonas fluorescens]|jgi:hypothetical protein|uniref:hypothetical protein n=1 Tax=Pseudomonas fluorescens TaxID=294 RepID=UPI0011C05CE9|nr:hypothetical protein [Pseudomonas fluorescens]
MSTFDYSSLRKIPDGNEKNVKGSLKGTIKNLDAEKEFPLEAHYFHRTNRHPIITIGGKDPEHAHTSDYFLQIIMDDREPATGTYKVGESGWKGCIYYRDIHEREHSAVSGWLELKNFQSIKRLEGELHVFASYHEIENYEIDVQFSIQGVNS